MGFFIWSINFNKLTINKICSHGRFQHWWQKTTKVGYEFLVSKSDTQKSRCVILSDTGACTSVRVAMASLSGGRVGLWHTRAMRRSRSCSLRRLAGGSSTQHTCNASDATCCFWSRPEDRNKQTELLNINIFEVEYAEDESYVAQNAHTNSEICEGIYSHLLHNQAHLHAQIYCKSMYTHLKELNRHTVKLQTTRLHIYNSEDLMY